MVVGAIEGVSVERIIDIDEDVGAAVVEVAVDEVIGVLELTVEIEDVDLVVDELADENDVAADADEADEIEELEVGGATVDVLTLTTVTVDTTALDDTLVALVVVLTAAVVVAASELAMVVFDCATAMTGRAAKRTLDSCILEEWLSIECISGASSSKALLLKS